MNRYTLLKMAHRNLANIKNDIARHDDGDRRPYGWHFATALDLPPSPFEIDGFSVTAGVRLIPKARRKVS
jgi:hypothetical protein